MANKYGTLKELFIAIADILRWGIGTEEKITADDFPAKIREMYGVGYDEGRLDGYEEGWDFGYNEGYSEGDADGYQLGYEEGFNDGWDEMGYEQGFSDGYDEGYYAAKNE